MGTIIAYVCGFLCGIILSMVLLVMMYEKHDGGDDDEQ